MRRRKAASPDGAEENVAPKRRAVVALKGQSVLRLLFFGYVACRAIYLTKPPAPTLKTAKELDDLREAGRLAATLLERLGSEIAPGVSTAHLDAVARAFVRDELGATPAPLHYGGLTGGLLRGTALGELICSAAHRTAAALSRTVWNGAPLPIPPLCGFPASICVSVNDVVAHGIPSESVVLKEYDLVNVDVTVKTASGAHGDTSKCWLVGGAPLDAPAPADEPSERELHVGGREAARRRKLALVARRALFVGIRAVRPGVSLGEVGAAIGKFVSRAGYSSVTAFVGHGIGSRFHEAPAVRHAAGGPNAGVVLKAGMVLTLEPMVNEGTPAVRIDDDGWTARTADGRDSAQWEHTIAVTADGVELLTGRPGEVPPQL